MTKPEIYQDLQRYLIYTRAAKRAQEEFDHAVQGKSRSYDAARKVLKEHGPAIEVWFNNDSARYVAVLDSDGEIVLDQLSPSGAWPYPQQEPIDDPEPDDE